ncbi:MAG TPA: spore protease YyaC [Firmicutes bacterium]|nr:spore protease YyaC [Bacillota bacterium]
MLVPEKVHVENPDAPLLLASALARYIESDLAGSGRPRDIVLLCVGTDRSTGDSLGPLVGTKMARLCMPGLAVYGTLEEPVHAANLESAIQKINSRLKNPYIIATDACLGRLENIGMITINRGPLKPGTGVNKSLPPVGNIHITGVVNVGGYMEYLVLQNTRLSLVMRMADIISEALAGGLEGAMRGIATATGSMSTSPDRGRER